MWDSGGSSGLEEPMEQRKFGAGHYSTQEGAGRMGEETRTPALTPQNPQAAGKGRRRTDGLAQRVFSLADRARAADEPTGPLRSLRGALRLLGDLGGLGG